MLHHLITSHRHEIIVNARHKVAQRPDPPPTLTELERGVPLLLEQLTQILRGEIHLEDPTFTAIGASEVQQANQLREADLTLPQVVQDYGDICDAITELAVRKRVSIAVEELQILNRCLETAVAEATAGRRLPRLAVKDGGG